MECFRELLEYPRLPRMDVVRVCDTEQARGVMQAELRHGADEHCVVVVFLEVGQRDSGRRGS